MKTETLTTGITMAFEECCNCGIVFGMPATMQNRLRRDGAFFYCPNGHSQHYTALETDKLKAELAQAARKLEYAETRARENREWAEHAERRASAARGVVTRLKNRAANGACPCCNRSFENLRRHMASKHPEFKNE